MRGDPGFPPLREPKLSAQAPAACRRVRKGEMLGGAAIFWLGLGLPGQALDLTPAMPSDRVGAF